MDLLQKYEKVNSCETIQALIQCIKDFSNNGIIQGRREEFDSEKMARQALNYFNDEENIIPPNVLTRQFGIRQQAMYLKYYKK